MKIEQLVWKEDTGWQLQNSAKVEQKKVQLVFAFGDRSRLEKSDRFEELKIKYPEACILMASTSGNIIKTNVDDDCIVVTAIHFEKPIELRAKKINVRHVDDSYAAGVMLMKDLPLEELSHLFVLSDGHLVNGTLLINGMNSVLPKRIAITGGLAGDGSHFKKTVVGLNAPPEEGEIVAIGFYGQHVKFGFGSIGGWDTFGVERKITRSKGNVLYELDGKLALALYKTYLGEYANQLPSSALLFPLAIRPDLQSNPLVRTILSIDESNQSMIFAGDVPEGWYAQLMKANFDRLVDGAMQAAHASYQMIGNADLAILISCIGRRLILGPNVEDELDSVREILGTKTVFTGFYSYGEICPSSPKANCELHNQTMTITTIAENE